MISKKYEIKKQVLGEDQDLEKSGRILNRVIEWDRDGITIQADQRHVREIMKGLELERANHFATPCAVERRDESKGENRCGRGQTKYRRNDVNDDDTRSRPRMVDDDAIDSQALTGGDITRYRALVARISGVVMNAAGKSTSLCPHCASGSRHCTYCPLSVRLPRLDSHALCKVKPRPPVTLAPAFTTTSLVRPPVSSPTLSEWVPALRPLPG